MIHYLSGILSFFAMADKWLLLTLNGFHCRLFDILMWTVSDKWVWIPFYVLLAYLVLRRNTWRHGVLCLLLIGMVILVTDQTCASLIRPAVQRLRPSSPDNPISSLVHIVNGYHGGRYGFPSCHAANSFALATFLSLYFRRRRMTILLVAWAAVVSYSRIYLGVHYPGDVLCGMLVGCMYSLLFWYVITPRNIRVEP